MMLLTGYSASCGLRLSVVTLSGLHWSILQDKITFAWCCVVEGGDLSNALWTGPPMRVYCSLPWGDLG